MTEPKLDKKLTQKQENFINVYLETGNASEAYRKAYDATKMSESSIGREAFSLIDNPKISSEIAARREKAAQKCLITVHDLVNELEEARIAALSAETPQASAATAATMGKAKLLGLDKQIIEQTVTATVEGSMNLNHEIPGLADKLSFLKGGQ